MFSFCNASACARTRSATLQSSWSPNREHCSRPKWNRHCVLCEKEELCVRAGCIWQNQAMTCSVSRAEQLSRSSPFPHGVTWARRKESFTAEWIHTAQVAHFKASLTPYVYETQQLFESHAVTSLPPLPPSFTECQMDGAEKPGESQACWVASSQTGCNPQRSRVKRSAKVVL